jgi:hypothetical protein
MARCIAFCCSPILRPPPLLIAREAFRGFTTHFLKSPCRKGPRGWATRKLRLIAKVERRHFQLRRRPPIAALGARDGGYAGARHPVPKAAPSQYRMENMRLMRLTIERATVTSPMHSMPPTRPAGPASISTPSASTSPRPSRWPIGSAGWCCRRASLMRSKVARSTAATDPSSPLGRMSTGRGICSVAISRWRCEVPHVSSMRTATGGQQTLVAFADSRRLLAHWRMRRTASG